MASGGVDGGDGAGSPGLFDPPLPRLLSGAAPADREAYIRSKVDRGKASIAAEGAILQAQLDAVADTGVLPREVLEVATEETLDAVGSLHSAADSLRSQLTETQRKLCEAGRDADKSYVDRVLAPTRRALAHEEALLVRATAAAAEWGLDLASVAARLPPTPPELAADCAKLPLATAATPGAGASGSARGLTVQRVLGVCVLASKPPLAEAALSVYNTRRAEATRGLVDAIFDDIDGYSGALEAIVADPAEQRAREGLAHLVASLPQSHAGEPVQLDTAIAWATEAIGGATTSTAPGGGGLSPTSLEFALRLRMAAVEGSLSLYNLVCAVAHSAHHRSHGHAPFVVPGGVKSLERIVFKTATKYGCDFSRCTDVSRCTVVASSLAAVLAIVSGLLTSTATIVVRCKNRFDSEYDAKPSGGYLDCQLLLLFRGGDGDPWRLGEVQVNLEEMVAIKEREGGGHSAFKFARSLAVFDPKTYVYSGPWSEEACAQMAAGVLLVVDMREGRVGGAERAEALAEAVRSPKCRTSVLNLRHCDLGPTGGTALAKALCVNRKITKIELGANDFTAEGGAAIAEMLRTNSTITILDVQKNNLGQSAAAIADALKTNTTLIDLNLEKNKLGANGGVALADALRVNAKLLYLRLRNNALGSEGGVAIANGLAKNTSLRTVGLMENKLDPQAGVALADALAINTSIAKLSLYKNNLGEKGGLAIANALCKNRTLTSLNLEYNKLGSVGCCAIAQALETNGTLKIIDLSGNIAADDELGGTQFGRAIAKALTVNTALTEIDLRKNNLRANGGMAIAKALGVNTTVQCLLLTENRLGAIATEALSTAGKESSSLRRLELAD